MEKKVIFDKLLTIYHEKAFTDNYMLAFTFDGVVYVVVVKADKLSQVLSLDKASRGAGYALRFKPNRATKRLMMGWKPEVLCSEDFFKAAVAESKYNKGEIIEKMLTEKAGQTWEKDNVPFTEDGDLTVNGIAYQIKFERATFINEKQAMRLERA